jgi:putative membrane protein
MATDPLHQHRARHLVLVVGAMLALLSLNATPGLASASEEQQGAQLLQSLQAGKQQCQQLARDQFELIGEYVMGRMVGSTARHEAMNQQITATSGASGEVQAHVFMGQRFAGCATGDAPAAFGSMMGMMGNYSGANGGMTGNGRDGGNGIGSNMMGGSGSRASGHDGWSSTNIVLVILVAVLAAALAALALAARRSWRRSPPKTPFDVLRDSYARGDIDTAEYEQRRQALESQA